jgi:hypothetical protein
MFSKKIIDTKNYLKGGIQMTNHNSDNGIKEPGGTGGNAISTSESQPPTKKKVRFSRMAKKHQSNIRGLKRH